MAKIGSDLAQDIFPTSRSSELLSLTSCGYMDILMTLIVGPVDRSESMGVELVTKPRQSYNIYTSFGHSVPEFCCSSDGPLFGLASHVAPRGQLPGLVDVAMGYQPRQRASRSSPRLVIHVYVLRSRTVRLRGYEFGLARVEPVTDPRVLHRRSTCADIVIGFYRGLSFGRSVEIQSPLTVVSVNWVLLISGRHSHRQQRWTLTIQIPDSVIRALELRQLKTGYRSPCTSSVPFGDGDSHPFNVASWPPCPVQTSSTTLCRASASTPVTWNLLADAQGLSLQDWTSTSCCLYARCCLHSPSLPPCATHVPRYWRADIHVSYSSLCLVSDVSRGADLVTEPDLSSAPTLAHGPEDLRCADYYVQQYRESRPVTREMLALGGMDCQPQVMVRTLFVRSCLLSHRSRPAGRAYLAQMLRNSCLMLSNRVDIRSKRRSRVYNVLDERIMRWTSGAEVSCFRRRIRIPTPGLAANLVRRSSTSGAGHGNSTRPTLFHAFPYGIHSL
ncbi:hypothetical protein EXIGLDRAFT_757408 [Exidia glandulosa HHB12029]|uniref:Uncharacterized protein n=1 Tax=Exidia glandulosa HHB12029 TaxID=1314781 RepID=A0A166N704_EXIGL|nr:hypothetical protein EXIGLDRAFT_757408 [Exidia glandulosa HHB12029]